MKMRGHVYVVQVYKSEEDREKFYPYEDPKKALARFKCLIGIYRTMDRLEEVSEKRIEPESSETVGIYGKAVFFGHGGKLTEVVLRNYELEDGR